MFSFSMSLNELLCVFMNPRLLLVLKYFSGRVAVLRRILVHITTRDRILDESMDSSGVVDY